MLRIAFILLSLTLSTFALAQEPVNLTSIKQELRRYHDSGEYAKDIKVVVSKAQSYLQDRVDANSQLSTPKKLAIVLDIDETSLSNYTLMSEYDFSSSHDKGYVPHMVDNKDATTIKPTYQLVQYAQNNDVAVFFVTGRPEHQRQQTVEILHRTGYENWDKLYLKPTDVKFASTTEYKSSVRKKIAAQGFDIVVNMGDQCSDLNGGYAEHSYKLPDPFYYLP